MKQSNVSQTSTDSLSSLSDIRAKHLVVSPSSKSCKSTASEYYYTTTETATGKVTKNIFTSIPTQESHATTDVSAFEDRLAPPVLIGPGHFSAEGSTLQIVNRNSSLPELITLSSPISNQTRQPKVQTPPIVKLQIRKTKTQSFDSPLSSSLASTPKLRGKNIRNASPTSKFCLSQRKKRAPTVGIIKVCSPSSFLPRAQAVYIEPPQRDPFQLKLFKSMDDLGFLSQRKLMKSPAETDYSTPKPPSLPPVKETKIEKGGSSTNLLQTPVYDMNGDMYISQKHKWRIYLQKRVKKKEETAEDPKELLQSVESYMKKSRLYSYNRNKKAKKTQAAGGMCRDLGVAVRTKGSRQLL